MVSDPARTPTTDLKPCPFCGRIRRCPAVAMTVRRDGSGGDLEPGGGMSDERTAPTTDWQPGDRVLLEAEIGEAGATRSQSLVGVVFRWGDNRSMRISVPVELVRSERS